MFEFSKIFYLQHFAEIRDLCLMIQKCSIFLEYKILDEIFEFVTTPSQEEDPQWMKMNIIMIIIFVYICVLVF